MGDMLIRGMTADGFVKIAAVETTQLVERARQIAYAHPRADLKLGCNFFRFIVNFNFRKTI